MAIKNREDYNAYMRVYMLARYNDFKNHVISLLGGRCKICGSLENLELHHINPKEKTFTLTQNWSQKEEALRAELAKCELLCGGCHREKHASPHGEDRRYRSHGCRCVVCTEAHKKRNALWAARKRQKRLEKT